MSKFLTVLIIGRFQPFHLGHLKLIKKAESSKDVNEIIVGIGSSQYKNTRKNPFSAIERKNMIEKSLSVELKKPFKILFIPDIGDNDKWVSHVEAIAGKFDLVYTNGEFEKRLFRKKNYEVRETEFFDREKLKGKEIRRRIKEGEEWRRFIPKGTLQIIEKVGGVERIRRILQ